MSIRIDYTQIAAKLDYAALEKKLAQLAEREPPKTRKSAADVLEPLRERLLALHRSGWKSRQLVSELKAVGIPIGPARLRECLNRWTTGGNGAARKRTAQRGKNTVTQSPPAATASRPATSKGATDAGQPALRLTGH